MKLKQIELCPFAGFNQRTVAFESGLNILLGENEAGKSTLINAIKAVLFENTTQNKRALQDFSDKYFPRGKSDQAKVVLVFVVGSIEYTLTKVWGAGKLAHLKASDGSSWNDDLSVQTQLENLLILHRGSWVTVLFADQNTLLETAQSIQAAAGDINRIPTLKNISGGIPGDIPAEDLMASLEALMETYSGQWDFISNGPKDNRGIQNKWVKSAGSIVKAYYAMEETKQQFHQLNQYERDLETSAEAFKRLSEEKSTKQTELQRYNGFKEAVNQQNKLKLALTEAKSQLLPMVVAMQNWTLKLDKQIQLNEFISQLEKSMALLEVEGRHAAKIESSQLPMAQYKRMLDLDKRIQEIQASLAKNGQVSQCDVDQIAQHKSAIQKIQISLAAQKLEARWTATQTTQFKLSAGIEAERTVDAVAGDSDSVEAAGQITFDLNGLRVEVKSALEPVDELIAKLAEHQQGLNEVLSRNQLQSLEEFERRLLLNQSETKQLATMQLQRKDALELTGKTIEALEIQAKELEAIPPNTRAVDVVRDQYRDEQHKQREYKKQLDEDGVLLQSWTQQYRDPSNLAILVGAKSLEVQQLETQLSELGGLPPEFPDEKAFRDHLATLEHRLDEITNELIDLERTNSRLQTQLEGFDSDALSLQAKLEIEETRFKRIQEEYSALLLAKKQLQILIDAEKSNPFEDFEKETASIFAAITEQRYTQIVREGDAPEGVVFKDQIIPIELLSGGTAGSLGLAVRLAYAKQYLSDMDGFVVLDDPFTDFDAGRRKAASQFLQDFATEKQVFVLTCHPDHAADLAGNRIELKKTT
ncbi:MAG: AAA family ATPase [Bacteroidota bacterium]